MSITAITYTDFEDGESGLSVRTKLNKLGNDVVELSKETEIDTAANTAAIAVESGRIDGHDTDIATNTTDIATAQATADAVAIVSDANTISIAALEAIQASSVEPTGFNLEIVADMGEIELCPLASSGIVYRIDKDNVFTKLTGQTEFGDGSSLVDRTFVQYPSAGEDSFSFWNKGVKFTKTTTQTIQLDEDAYKKIICYDENGDLLLADTVHAAITDLTLVAVVTGNPLEQKKVVFANERHGIAMSGATHLFEHETTGARIGRGSQFAITGLANNATEFIQIEAGVIYDEDIQHTAADVTSTIFLWREGVGGDWTMSDIPNAKLAHKDGDDKVVYNKYDEPTDAWSIEPIGSDYVIMHFFGSNDGEYAIAKVIGQVLYPDRTTARKNLYGDVTNLKAGNLPTPEFVHLYSMIINNESAGEIEKGSDDEIYVDFRSGYPVARY